MTYPRSSRPKEKGEGTATIGTIRNENWGSRRSKINPHPSQRWKIRRQERVQRDEDGEEDDGRLNTAMETSSIVFGDFRLFGVIQ